MPDRVTTSFIPKESLVSERGPRLPTRNPFAFVNLIAGVILVGAIAICGGLFLFQTYTQSSIKSKQESLERQRAAFEPATIQELLRLDKRLTASNTLLKNHTALSLLFNDLEARTGANVRFKDFKFEPAGTGHMTVSMSGTAKSFNAVALQSDAFGKSAILKDPIFAGLNIDQTGTVVFTFTALVDPVRLGYATLVAGEAAAPIDVVPEPVPELSTTTPAL